MKARFIFILIGATLLPLSPLCRAAPVAEPQVIDGIAAVVNDDVITFSQVRVLSAPKERLLRSQYQGQELLAKTKEARAAALKDLIDRQLMIQAFKKESYQIPDFFLDQRVRQIIDESFGGDRNTFIKTLQAQNYTLGEFEFNSRAFISALILVQLSLCVLSSWHWRDQTRQGIGVVPDRKPLQACYG